MVSRFWEIDFLRGTAVIMMIIFHFLFDLEFFLGIGSIASAFWFWFARLTAGIFVFLLGFSLALSFSRTAGLSSGKRHKKFLKRGAKIFFYGLLITLITFFAFSDSFIFFGILHFAGISIIAGHFFLKWKWKSLALSIIVLACALLLRGIAFGMPGFIIAGQVPSGIYSFDFFQFLQWFWLVLFGIFAGNILYPEGKRIIAVKELGEKIISRQFSWLGRNSLKIYFIHQPVLIGVILLAEFFSG